MIKIELRGLGYNCLGIVGRTEVQFAGRHAADDAGLCRERNCFKYALLVGYVGDSLRHADAEIDRVTGLQFKDGPPCDNFSGAHRQAWHRGHRHLGLPAEGWVIDLCEGLPVMRLIRYHHSVHQHTRDDHKFGVECTALGNPFHLHHNNATAALNRHGLVPGIPVSAPLFPW